MRLNVSRCWFRIYKATINLLFSVLIIFSNACSKDEPAQKIDLSKRESVGTRKQESVVTYAYLPQYSHSVSFQRHHPLVEYLEKETALNIKQVFPDTFDEHIRMVEQGKIDISYSNPFVYIKIAHRAKAKAFARTIEVYGKDYFRGQIVCRSDNETIRTISDCRGKRWIAVDPSSAGGYIFALGHFARFGIFKDDFSEIAFAPGPGGKQEKVVLAVYAGRYDIGSVREGTLDIVSDKVDISQIRVIAHTQWYPGWVYAHRSGLAQEIVDKIKTALYALDSSIEPHEIVLKAAKITAVVSASDSEFDPVRELASQIDTDDHY
jgi:phosphonate transport system substrate-binding protein